MDSRSIFASFRIMKSSNVTKSEIFRDPEKSESSE